MHHHKALNLPIYYSHPQHFRDSRPTALALSRHIGNAPASRGKPIRRAAPLYPDNTHPSPARASASVHICTHKEETKKKKEEEDASARGEDLAAPYKGKGLRQQSVDCAATLFSLPLSPLFLSFFSGAGLFSGALHRVIMI